MSFDGNGVAEALASDLTNLPDEFVAWLPQSIVQPKTIAKTLSIVVIHLRSHINPEMAQDIPAGQRQYFRAGINSTLGYPTLRGHASVN